MTRYSRASACADGRSSPGGCFRSTRRQLSKETKKGGFDCPPVTVSSRNVPSRLGRAALRNVSRVGGSKSNVLRSERSLMTPRQARSRTRLAPRSENGSGPSGGPHRRRQPGELDGHSDKSTPAQY